MLFKQEKIAKQKTLEWLQLQIHLLEQQTLHIFDLADLNDEAGIEIQTNSMRIQALKDLSDWVQKFDRNDNYELRE